MVYVTVYCETLRPDCDMFRAVKRPIDLLASNQHHSAIARRGHGSRGYHRRQPVGDLREQ